jgi:hypothetical protein
MIVHQLLRRVHKNVADIFLSYAHENVEQARMLAELLAGYGWTVFWDREILAGTVFDDVIQQQLDQAKCVICLWSVHSVSSQWVRAEAEEGANRNMLVSVLIEDVRLPIAFRRIQAAKLLNWTGSKEDEQLKDVLRAVKFVVEKPPQAEGTAAAQPDAPAVAAAAAPPAAPALARVPTAAPQPSAPPTGTRSPAMIAAVLAGVLVLGGAVWMVARTGTAGTPVSDEQLITDAREFADSLGHGKIAAARAQFTPQLQATPAATQWRPRLQSLGELVQVEPPERVGGSGGLRDVRVVMKHQNGSIEAVLTFIPNGKVCGLSVPNSVYKGGCK